MGKHLINIFILVYLGHTAVGQEKLDMLSVDSRTYRFYMEQKWDSLIYIGKQGLDNQIDFYYLRLRLGIAYFEQNNYRQATRHLKVALAMDPGNSVTREYTYLSLLYSGQYADARNCLLGASDALKNKFEFKTFTFSPVFFTGFMHNYRPGDEIWSRFSPVSDSVPGSQAIPTNLIFGSAMLFHQTKFGWIRHGYTFTNKLNYRYFKTHNSVYLIENEHVQQHQYYLGTGIYIGKGFEISGSVNYFFHRIPVYFQQNNFKSGGEGAGPGPGSGSIEPDPGQIVDIDPTGLYYFYDQTHNLIVNLSLKKSIGMFDIEISPYYSYINSTNHFQNEFITVYYPFGNLNLYFLANYSFHNYTLNNKPKFEHVFQSKSGFRLTDFLWTECFAMNGTMDNFVTGNGRLVYNDENPVSGQYGIRLLLPFKNQRITTNISFVHTTYKSFFTEKLTGDQSNEINFQTYSINGGIQWDL